MNNEHFIIVFALGKDYPNRHINVPAEFRLTYTKFKCMLFNGRMSLPLRVTKHEASHSVLVALITIVIGYNKREI